jgi:hypothetical protein
MKDKSQSENNIWKEKNQLELLHCTHVCLGFNMNNFITLKF